MKASTLKMIGELSVATDLALRERYKAKMARAALFRKWTNETGEYYDSSVLGEDQDPEVEAARAAYLATTKALARARTKLRAAIRKAA